jgi:PAS domain S-box-containing protein
MLDFFQLSPPSPYQIIGFYDSKLVLFSYIVAVFASYIALNIASNVKSSLDEKPYSPWWLIGGATTMGMGIWTMHFIGMAAFITPLPITYGPFLTSLSLVIAIVASGFALFLVARSPVKTLSILLGGILMGLAIASMHYVGMAAMNDVNIRYIPSLFFLSILIAIIASQAALWLMVKSNSIPSFARFNILSAFIMGAAICGMHYVGMFAAVLTPNQMTPLPLSPSLIPAGLPAFYIGTTTSFIMLAFLVFSSNNKKFLLSLQQKNEALKIKEEQLSTANQNLSRLATDLGDKENRTRAILTTAADGIITFNQSEQIEMINPAAETIFGYEKNELLQKKISNLIDIPETPFNEIFDHLVSIKKPLIELIGIRKDSSIFPCEVTISELNVCEGTSYIMIIRDITNRKIAERNLELTTQKLLRSLIELEEARNHAEQANMAKSIFLAVMSHEIRTPLNAIIGTASLMARTDMGTREKKYVNRILSSSRILLNLINDILDFSKIEAGELKLEAVPSNFLLLLKEVASIMEVRAVEKKIEFIIHYNTQNPTDIITDPLRIKQILTNLIGNAIKFTEKGYVKIDMATTQIDKDHILIKLEVKDSGIGINKENFSRIFQKFSQVDTSSIRKFSGTGLGLAISKELVELLGGKIGFESEINIGSVFWFEIPFLINKEVFTKTIEDSFKVPRNLHDLKILIVDDSEINLQILEDYIKHWNMTCYSCQSSFRALQLIEEEAKKGIIFNVGLLDYNMPDMNGLELARKIKKLENYQDVVLILLTSFCAQPDKEVNKGTIDNYLFKPIYPFDLYDTIVSSLSKKKQKNKD